LIGPEFGGVSCWQQSQQHRFFLGSAVQALFDALEVPFDAPMANVQHQSCGNARSRLDVSTRNRIPELLINGNRMRTLGRTSRLIAVWQRNAEPLPAFGRHGEEGVNKLRRLASGGGSRALGRQPGPQISQQEPPPIAGGFNSDTEKTAVVTA
jgi:hypothetical protein